MLTGSYCFSVAQPNYVSTNALRAYWPFNTLNNANDIVASFAGTLFPQATPPQLVNDRFGTANNAYNFSGSNWIQTPFKGILGDSTRAVSFWAKTPGNGGAGMYPVGWGGNGTGDRFGCSLDYPANQVAAGGANCSQAFSTPLPTSTNLWHHYVFQFSASTYGSKISNVKVWQDAAQIFTTSAGSYMPSQTLFTINNFNVTFGKIIYPAGPAPYIGSLDEVGIWKRLLTQCEISDLYYADVTIGSMTFNAGGYLGAVMNLAQYTQTLSGNAQFSTAIVAGTYSGTGVSLSGGQYNFNSPATLPSGLYSITHTYTLQGGCVRSATQTIQVIENNTSLNAEKIANWNFEIYPNPTAGDLHFVSDVSNGILTLRITDVSGKQVYAADFDESSHNDVLKLSMLDDAIYFIEVKNRNGNSLHKKLIIAR